MGAALHRKSAPPIFTPRPIEPDFTEAPHHAILLSLDVPSDQDPKANTVTHNVSLATGMLACRA